MSFTVLTFTFLLYLTQALNYTINSSQITGVNITCDRGQDCMVKCVDCTNKMIYCPSSFSCFIDCVVCDGATIQANQAVNVNINCTQCTYAQIDASLSSLESQFELNCHADYACDHMHVSIDHDPTIYTQQNMSDIIDYTTKINCYGSYACYYLYAESAINGNSRTICDGSYACYRVVIIYNPPLNSGKMDLQCIGSMKYACSSFYIMSPSAQTIDVQCGDGTNTNLMYMCHYLFITGPVMPFDDIAATYSMDNIRKDSVTIDCNQCYYCCHQVYVFVPFGPFQTRSYNDPNGDVGWPSCGWDFPEEHLYPAMEYPPRFFSCDNADEVNEIVGHFLSEGANIIVTNKFNTHYTCPDDQHCIVYALTNDTTIDCPRDTVSTCYVLAMRENALSASIINGIQTKLLLVKAYGLSRDAGRALYNTTIYGPDSNYGSDGGILSIPMSDASEPYHNVIIHADNTETVIIAEADGGFHGATWFVSSANWINIECGWFMCHDMKIYVDNPTFDVAAGDIIPDNLCIACYMNGCTGMVLNVNDTSTATQWTFTTTTLNVLKEWHWIAVDNTSGIEPIPIPTLYIDANCSEETSSLLNDTWYPWYDPLVYLLAGAPRGCDWFFVEDKDGPQWGPPIDNYCFTGRAQLSDNKDENSRRMISKIDESSLLFAVDGEPVESWKMSCNRDTGLGEFRLYRGVDDCSGYGVLTDEYGEGGIYSDCTSGILCEYATFTFKEYYSTRIEDGTIACYEPYFSHYMRDAVFLNKCHDGLYLTCSRDGNGVNTLRYGQYNDTENCTGIPRETGSFIEGECILKMSSDSDYMTDTFVEEINCYEITEEPTLAPTPNCLSIYVNVIDAGNEFDENEFNGLYTYKPSQIPYDRPLWEVPQDPNNRNLRYYPGNWVIHGSGDGVLSHVSTSFFPPHKDVNAEWIHSDIDGIFHVYLRCIDTYSPTSSPTTSPLISSDTLHVINNYDPSSSPTSAPTRDPTASGDIYDGTITIIYMLTNLTNNNYDSILNYRSNDAIDNIIAIIESHYLSPLYLSSYQFFMIETLLLNGIDYKVNGQLTKDVLYNKPILYLRSEIAFKGEYAFYLITISQDTDWYYNVTKTFRKFFNNSIVIFSVANSSALSAHIEEEEISPTFKVTISILTIFLFFCIFISFLAYLYNKHSCQQYQWLPCDSANYLAPTFYGLAVYDIISDIMLTSEIFTQINNDGAHIDGKDKEGKIDSFREHLLIISGWGCFLFILIPYCMNVYYSSRIPRLTQYNIRCRAYFSSNISIFITLVAFSGACYPSLELVSSGIFGLALLDCGLSSFELTQLEAERVLILTLSYNIPQLLFQILYSYSIGLISPNTVLAFCTSFASAVCGLLIYFIHRDKKGHVHNIDFYLEVKHKNECDLTEIERKHINRYKGMKDNLCEGMVNVYENIQIENFEIGYVTLKRDNFLIRCIKHLHEEDLYGVNDKLLYNKKQEKETETRYGYDDDDDEEEEEYIMEEMNEYQTYCNNSYIAHKQDIDNKIFDHYNELDSNLFTVQYHAFYPGLSYVENVENVGDKSPVDGGGGNYYYGKNMNLKQMIQLSTTRKGQNNDGLEPEIMSSHYEFWHDRRNQFDKGYKIIKGEVEKLKIENKGKYVDIDSMQIHRFIRILNANNINPIVIEDCIKFAIESNTFKPEDTRNSDIDEDNTNTNHHDIDQQIQSWANEEDEGGFTA